MSEVLASTSDSTFDNDVLQSELPVLVDFWAPWCGPCRALTPIIESMTADYANKLKIVKLNVSDNTDIAAKYQIKAIPTLMIFKSGEAVATQVGGDLSKARLANFIDTNI